MIIPQQLTLSEIQRSFQSLQSILSPFESSPYNLAGRRIGGAGKAVDDFDYVTKFDVMQLLSKASSSTAKASKPATTALRLNGAVRIGVFATRGAATAHIQQLFSASDMGDVIWISDGISWKWSAGIYSDVLANRPGSLAAADAGFRFLATDTAQHFRWTGTAWVEEYQINDAVTNAATSILNLVHRSSGAPAAGYGASLAYQLDSSTNVLRTAGLLDIDWSASTNTAESADFVVRLMNGGTAAAEKFRVTGAGNLKAVGKITVYNNTAPLNGQILIGNTIGGRFDAATLTGTADQVIVTNAAGTVTLSLPQDVDTSATPVFAGLTLNPTAAGLTVNGANSFNAITSNPGSNAYGLAVVSSGTTGQSFGIGVTAGTNSSDQALLIQNAASAKLFEIRGDGALFIGTSQGASGTFKSADATPKTVTVTNGIITSIV